jgi:PAS domain-containing protein
MENTELIGGLLGGGLIKALFDYLVGTKKANKDDFETIVQKWQEDNSRLRHENASMETRLTLLASELATLKSKMMLLETSHFDAPIPMWLVDTQNTYIAINKAYEEYFLAPLGKTVDDCIGKTKTEVWPDISPDVIKNNIHVLKSQSISYLTECYDTTTQETHRVIKYPRFVGNVRIGVAGIVIPQRWV